MTKKAFTLVELLVVIAIVAILAVAGVVGYMAFTAKANQSNDTTLVAQLNSYIEAAGISEAINTTTDARNILIQDGIDLATLKLTAKDYKPAFDIASKKFYKVKGTDAEDFEGNNVDLFVFVANSDEAATFAAAGYSVYLQAGYNGTEITLNGTSVDTGENNTVTTVTYNNAGSGKTVLIRTSGDQTKLTINAPNDDINYYGFAQELTVKAVKASSLHIYGATNELAVESGHVQVEPTGIVFDVVQIGAESTGAGATITNSGYVAAATMTKNTEAVRETAKAAVTGKVIGGDYEIGTLAQLEAFRDAVNAGNNFRGITVKLTANITLRDGWRPIGEGGRKVGATNASETGTATYFDGTFDGNNKTISNLNNKGFTPTSTRLTDDKVGDVTYKTYAYGLFALVWKNATIKDLVLTNVDIDTTASTSYLGDSVAALVGYSNGGTFSNITVSGSIKAQDAVAGIVGRIYAGSGVTATISGCTNNASITIGTASNQKGAGIAGYLGTEGTYVLSNNTNNGAVTGGYVTTSGAMKASIATIDTKIATQSRITLSGNKAGTTDVTEATAIPGVSLVGVIA